MGTEKKLNSYTQRSTGGEVSKNIVITPKPSVLEIYTTNPNNAVSPTSNGLTAGTKTQQPECADVPHIAIHIREDDVVTGAKEILRIIRPDWNLDAVDFKIFTDGITNKLVGCFYTAPFPEVNVAEEPVSPSRKKKTRKDSISEVDSDDVGALFLTPEESKITTVQQEQSVVLVRVYGNKTDLLIDRNAERRNFLLLHSYGYAPALYATFKNGLAYDYVPGVTLNVNNVLKPEIWALVARRMAEMHRTVAVAGMQKKPVPMLWKKTQSFLNLVPEKFSDPDKHRRLSRLFLPIKRMREEFAILYKRLEALNSPIVFAHNDLLLGNVIYTESRQSVNFIDYEYADFNFQAFDIGNHFAEYAGVDEVDYSRYPSKEFQMQWLRAYLQTYLLTGEVPDVELHRLYIQVNQFALAAHFFWTTWSLIQAEHSTLDFDYAGYAILRYKEYMARRNEFLSLNSKRNFGRSKH